MRTLDLSNNNIKSLGRLSTLTELKSLNLDKNALRAGSLSEISKTAKLQSLSCAHNSLGVAPSSAQKGAAPTKASPPPKEISNTMSLPPLPVSLKQIMLASNQLHSFPQSLLSPSLVKLEKIDLSDNQISQVPEAISALVGIQELRLDRNLIAILPNSMGEMKKLKVLSLKNNRITVKSTTFTEKNPQPIPASLFTDTPLIDLNLHGNKMSNTQLNQFDGFDSFLERRQKVKSKTLTNLEVCGLE